MTHMHMTPGTGMVMVLAAGDGETWTPYEKRLEVTLEIPINFSRIPALAMVLRNPAQGDDFKSPGLPLLIFRFAP